MANWLERARREISSGADRATAKTAERNPTAVMAVPDPCEAEISGGSIGSNGSARTADLQETETVVPRPWLAHIKETDGAIIAHLLDQFRAYHEQHGVIRLADLRSSYDSLFHKLHSLLEDADPPLARDIDRSRSAIWEVLADPRKFSASVMGGA